jgi:hypothetical protein
MDFGDQTFSNMRNSFGILAAILLNMHAAITPRKIDAPSENELFVQRIYVCWYACWKSTQALLSFSWFAIVVVCFHT